MSEDKINELKFSIIELQQDVKHIKEGLDLHVEKEEEHFQKMAETIEKFFQSADQKYAPRIIWDILIWMARIVGGAIVLGIVGLIYEIMFHLQK